MFSVDVFSYNTTTRLTWCDLNNNYIEKQTSESVYLSYSLQANKLIPCYYNSFYFPYFFSTFNYLLWACCYAFSFYFLYFEVRSCFYETRFKQFTVLLSFSLLSILIFFLLLILSLNRQITFLAQTAFNVTSDKDKYSQIFLQLLFFVRVDIISIFICFFF